MLNNPNSMQGVSGNEFLKDGCYFTNVVQSLLKTNDFLINKCFILLLYFFFLELQKPAENIVNFIDQIANMTDLMSITVSNVSGS